MIRPEHKILGLIGAGCKPVAIIVHHESLTNECEICTPLLNDIKECSTAAEIKALVAPNEDSEVTYPGSACFALAPWLSNTLLNEDSQEPFVLILAAFAAATQFDSLHENDPDFSDKALDHAEDFALWAWGVSAGRITETKIAIRPEDGELTDHLNSRMKQCIMPTVDTAIAAASAGDNASVFLQLSTAISKQSEEAGIANRLRREEIDRAIERDESKKDKTNKLHSSIMNMLLMAASIDGDQAANELPATCLSFFNKETEGLADQELRFQFEALGFQDVHFAHSFISNARIGNLQYAHEGLPSNFSIFSFFESLLHETSRGGQQLLLHLMESHCQGLSEAAIKKMTKQVIKIPTDYNGMEAHLEFFGAALEIFFGPNAEPTKGVKSFSNALRAKRAIIKSMMASRASLAAEILYALDLRFQRFLDSCRMAKDRSEVSNLLVNFDDLVNSILDRSFSRTLPSSFKASTTDTADDTEADGNNDVGGGKKRGKKRQKTGDDANPRINNPEPIKEFALTKEDNWTKNFSGQCLEDRPKWGKGIMCPRWHSRGFCFGNCFNIESHVPESKVPNEKKTEYRNYLKKVRTTKQ